MRLPGWRAAGAARGAQPARLHPREHCRRRRAEPQTHEDGPPRRRAVPQLAVTADACSNGAVEALLDLNKAGKVRFIGMSGTFPHLKDHIAMGVFDVFQIPYSAVEREHETAIAAASAAGAGIVIRGGAAK